MTQPLGPKGSTVGQVKMCIIEFEFVALCVRRSSANKQKHGDRAEELQSARTQHEDPSHTAVPSAHFVRISGRRKLAPRSFRSRMRALCNCDLELPME